MELVIDQFPVFEANQVLTNTHLNGLFGYLDQQSRQTRSHLIGIGICCGLEISLDGGGNVLLTRGCGVTSEGYLIIESEDVTLTSYRTYTAPADLIYPPFTDSNGDARYDLWELFEAGEPNTTALGSPAGFLDGKAVLLFLELKKQGLRNCSSNSCDDKGSEVIATARRLLIRSTDLNKIIAAANALGGRLTSSDIDAALAARLGLADLRLGRFDAPNTKPVTSNDVYAAFLKIFHAQGLAKRLADALSAAYAAFQPVLAKAWPNDPFTGFSGEFGFLDGAPTDTTQVKFLQYYVDLFDDLVRAYDEFRWKGAELICGCCPPEDLLPRHLMLGLLHPEKVAKPNIYRQGFLPSPAMGCCREQTVELGQLFSRLVGMTKSFTNAPPLPVGKATSTTDPQIRVTPSVLGERPLAPRAIPYYFTEGGAPPLHRLWSPERTRRNRAALNLGYRSDEYLPPAPAFVTSPLNYDLEPYDFLRIEGHLGKDYRHVLSVLLALAADRRLPIDIIALRAGVYDDTQPVDLTKEATRFQDLDAVYETLRAELLRSLAEGVMELYDAPVANFAAAGGTPKLPLLVSYAPNYRYPANSVGAWFEQYISLFQSRPYIDVDQNKVDANAVLLVYCFLFQGTSGLANENFPHAVAIYYMTKLAELLPASLDSVVFADLQNKYEDLLGLVRYFRTDQASKVPADLKTFLPSEELLDLFDQILFDSKLDAISAIHDEQAVRIKDLRKRQFLSSFLAAHPGIQHKAGVPIGGTFIIVYHQDPAPPPAAGPEFKAEAIALELAPERLLEAAVPAQDIRIEELAARQKLINPALTDAIHRLGANKALAEHPDVGLILGALLGQTPIFLGPLLKAGLGQASVEIIAKAVGELADGEVIADFYLPYRCCCDGSGVQYVLAPTPPSFAVDLSCTDQVKATAAVVVQAKGGTAPYEVSVDQGTYQDLDGAIELSVGAHTLRLRDAEGTESIEHTVQVPSPLRLLEPTFQCRDGEYVATMKITGGTPPYTIDGQVLPGADYSTPPTPSGKAIDVKVIDSHLCTNDSSFSHECPLPLGITVEMGCANVDNMSNVAVNVTGGTAPFQVQVDEGEFQLSTGSILLAAGAHTLRIKDAVGSESLVLSIEVPAAVTISDPNFTCDDNRQFTAAVTIAGGTPPYTVNGQVIGGTQFTTQPAKSGTQVTLDVTDRRGCGASRSFTHVCLPCGGIAVKRGYRFWAPEADPNNRYLDFKFGLALFRVEDVDLSDEVRTILTQPDPQGLDPAGFAKLARTWVDQINALIVGDGRLADGDRPWISLEYRPTAPGRLGELWIEYFQCLKFEIEIQTKFLRDDDRKVQLSVSYTPEQTLIKGDDGEATSPAFDGQRIDKNGPEPAVEPICAAPPASTLKIKPLQGGMNPTFAGGATPSIPGATLLWEVPGGVPTWGNGASITTQYRTQGTKQVTLTAFTMEKGCSVSQTFQVQILG